MAKNKTGGKTRRERYDEILLAGHHKMCKDCAVLGFDFENDSRAEQFHYALMDYAADEYFLFDKTGTCVIVVADKGANDKIGTYATMFGGRAFRVRLDEEI